MTRKQLRQRVETITRRALALLNAGRAVTPGYAEVARLAGRINPAALYSCRCGCGRQFKRCDPPARSGPFTATNPEEPRP